MFENTSPPIQDGTLSHIVEFYVDIDLLDVVSGFDDDPTLNPRGEIHDTVWLQTSMTEEGQLTAIEVLPTKDGRFLIDDGHTRFIAAKAMGWSQLRAKYPHWWDGEKVDVVDKAKLLLHMLASNVRRNVPPSRQGKSFVALVNRNFITVERLASTMGMDVPTVQDYINLATAPETIQRRVDNFVLGKEPAMSWTAFKEWRKKPEKVKRVIAASTEDKDFSVRGLREKAHEVRTGEPKPVKMSVIEEVAEANKVNPMVAAFKTAAMGIIANWYDLSPADQEEVLYTVANLNELMEQN